MKIKHRIKMITLAFLLPLFLILSIGTAWAGGIYFSATVKIKNLPANWVVTDSSYKKVQLNRSSDGTATTPAFPMWYPTSESKMKLYVFDGKQRMGAITVGSILRTSGCKNDHTPFGNCHDNHRNYNDPLYKAAGVVSFQNLVRTFKATNHGAADSGKIYTTYNYTYVFSINK